MVTYGHFMKYLAKLGYISQEEANSEDNKFLSNNTLQKDSKIVVKAVETYNLSLAELNLIFKGA